jgi:hypothetical protein
MEIVADAGSVTELCCARGVVFRPSMTSRAQTDDVVEGVRVGDRRHPGFEKSPDRDDVVNVRVPVEVGPVGPAQDTRVVVAFERSLAHLLSAGSIHTGWAATPVRVSLTAVLI